jgi:hypothetical protein
MHWKISQFPELDHLDAEQRAALLRGVSRWTYTIVVLRAVFAGIVAGGATCEVAAVAVPSLAGFGGTVVAIFLVGAAAGGLGTYVVQLRLMRVTLGVGMTFGGAMRSVVRSAGG